MSHRFRRREEQGHECVERLLQMLTCRIPVTADASLLIVMDKGYSKPATVRVVLEQECSLLTACHADGVNPFCEIEVDDLGKPMAARTEFQMPIGRFFAIGMGRSATASVTYKRGDAARQHIATIVRERAPAGDARLTATSRFLACWGDRSAQELADTLVLVPASSVPKDSLFLPRYPHGKDVSERKDISVDDDGVAPADGATAGSDPAVDTAPPAAVEAPATAGTPSAYTPSTVGNVGLDDYLPDHDPFQADIPAGVVPTFRLLGKVPPAADVIAVHAALLQTVVPLTAHQRTQDWFILRRFRVTATVAARFRTLFAGKDVDPAAVWPHLLRNWFDTKRFGGKRGALTEDAIVERIPAWLGIKAKVYPVGLLANREHRWLACSPNGILQDCDTGDLSPVEAMTCTTHASASAARLTALKFGKVITCSAGDETWRAVVKHKAQVAHQAAVLRAQEVIYAVATRTAIAYVVRIKFSRSQLAAYREGLEPFHKFIQWVHAGASARPPKVPEKYVEVVTEHVQLWRAVDCMVTKRDKELMAALTTALQEATTQHATCTRLDVLCDISVLRPVFQKHDVPPFYPFRTCKMLVQVRLTHNASTTPAAVLTRSCVAFQLLYNVWHSGVDVGSKYERVGFNANHEVSVQCQLAFEVMNACLLNAFAWWRIWRQRHLLEKKKWPGFIAFKRKAHDEGGSFADALNDIAENPNVERVYMPASDARTSPPPSAGTATTVAAAAPASAGPSPLQLDTVIARRPKRNRFEFYGSRTEAADQIRCVSQPALLWHPLTAPRRLLVWCTRLSGQHLPRKRQRTASKNQRSKRYLCTMCTSSSLVHYEHNGVKMRRMDRTYYRGSGGSTVNRCERCDTPLCSQCWNSWHTVKRLERPNNENRQAWRVQQGHGCPVKKKAAPPCSLQQGS